MSASPFVHTEARIDRRSDAPLAVDLRFRGPGGHHTPHGTGSNVFPPGWQGGWSNRMPQALAGMWGYIVAGVSLGVLLIVGLVVARGDGHPTAAGVVTDNIVHLGSREIGDSCWRGTTDGGPARLTVSLEVGLDGKVRTARAAGESPAMRGCVESHVKAWEFLPQATSSQMVLPFEIQPR